MFLELVTGVVVHHAAADHASRSAQREPLHDWSGVAHCESTDDWHINTGNGYYGGLQESQSTWDSFGGREFAPRPDLATEAQQIVVAERIYAVQGDGAWPVCHVYLRSAA